LALRRDAQTCQNCGKQPLHSYQLHVHHIQPAYTFNGDYESANKLTNLITLCIPCHKKAERGEIPVQRKMF
jgi:5-methylcytosine-specific restriction endonuclease McrA